MPGTPLAPTCTVMPTESASTTPMDVILRATLARRKLCAVAFTMYTVGAPLKVQDPPVEEAARLVAVAGAWMSEIVHIVGITVLEK